MSFCLVFVAQSCLTLCDSMDCSPPGSSVHGILQARVLEWVAMPTSRASSQCRVQTRVSYSPCIGRSGWGEVGVYLYRSRHLGSPFLCPVLSKYIQFDLENFEHYFASVWDECNCAVVWAFFGIAILWNWNENGHFPVLWPLLGFPNLLAYWVQHFDSIIF